MIHYSEREGCAKPYVKTNLTLRLLRVALKGETQSPHYLPILRKEPELMIVDPLP